MRFGKLALRNQENQHKVTLTSQSDFRNYKAASFGFLLILWWKPFKVKQKKLPSLQFVITNRLSLFSPLNLNDRSIPLTCKIRKAVYKKTGGREKKGFQFHMLSNDGTKKGWATFHEVTALISNFTFKSHQICALCSGEINLLGKIVNILYVQCTRN